MLAIVGITSVLAFQLTQLQTLTISHASLTQAQDQLLAYSWGVEEMVSFRLYADWLEGEERPFDNRDEKWASNEVDFELPNTTVKLAVIDLDAYFNINALGLVEGDTLINTLYELSQFLYLDFDIAPKIKDWVDEDSSNEINGGEDYDYSGYEIPFRTANQFAMDVSEVRIFKDINRDDLKTLKENVVALPTEQFKLNVNTVEEDVIESLTTALDINWDASYMTQESRDFETIEDFIAKYNELEPIQDYLSVSSNFFRMKATVIDDDRGRIDLTSTFYRNPQSGEVSVYKRDYGERHEWVEEEQY